MRRIQFLPWEFAWLIDLEIKKLPDEPLAKV